MNNFSKPNIPVVYYHSLGPKDPNWVRNYLTLELPFFEDQLRYYKRHFDVITLQEYYQIRSGQQKGPKNPLVITIDDGYLDNWAWAFPLFKKYELPATIFVCPELADPRDIVRPTLEDYQAGGASLEELSQPGFLSWEEMRLMESSGLIDIQSHTMSHTKYFVSDKLRAFHRPGADALYPIGNLFPEEKPFHINNPAFDQLLPYGSPFFEEKSSVIARKVIINPSFSEACVAALSDYDFRQYRFEDAYQKVAPIYEDYRKKELLILAIEEEKAYRKRVQYEVEDSKKIIEEKLNKGVDFLCWPHGDNNALAHQAALDAGYLATTTGSGQELPDTLDRIPIRIGIMQVRNNRLLSQIKARYKIGLHQGRSPWKEAQKLYALLRS